MTTPLTKDELKMSVDAAFESGIPNGWILGWEESRFQAQINRCIHPHTVENWTSFDYAFCNNYEVIFRTNDRISYSLTILISFISDVYCMHWTAYSADGRSGRVVPTPEIATAMTIEKNLRLMLDELGIQEIPDEWLSEPVTGISLELSGERNVTLAKCLFRDYDDSD